MTRLPLLRPDQLDEAQAALRETIAGGRRAQGPQHFRLTDDDGALTGPFNALLHAPAVGTGVSGLGEAIRYGSTLSARVRELAILTGAAAWGADFERYAHEPIARAVGIDEGVITALRERRQPDLPDAAEAAAYRFCRAVVDEGTVPDDLFRATVDVLGLTQVVELTILVGYYRLLATVLEVFQVGLPGE